MKSTREYSQLISAFLQLEKRLTQDRIERYTIFLRTFRELLTALQDEKKENPPYFNPLDLFNIDEITYSKFFAWCFNPHESHCQGDLLFKGFINHFGFHVTLRSMEYKVYTEFAGNEAIVDILIYGEDFMFYIENKLFSGEGLDQTNREFRDMLRLSKALGVSRENLFPVYLSPGGNRPENQEFRPISYFQMAQALEGSLGEIKSDYIKHFIQSWIEDMKSIGG